MRCLYLAHHEIWRLPKGSQYQWVREPETRQWFEAKKYIQPDIYDFDASRRSAGPNNKSVVIEVIRTHEPETETYDRLVKLSELNHLVLFYFCNPNKNHKGSWLGTFDPTVHQPDQPLRLRIEHYLVDGMFYKQGTLFLPEKSEGFRRAKIFEELDRIKKL